MGEVAEVMPMTSIEKVSLMTGGKCLVLRKYFQYLRRYLFIELTDIYIYIYRSIQSGCYRIIKHSAFEGVTLTIILLNCLMLAFEDPTTEDNGEFYEIADYVFLALYTVEMIMKILGLGFILNTGAYLRDGWNILDFIIVISAYVMLVVSSGPNLRVLRGFRILRPLRTISGVEGLKILVTSLIAALPQLGNTLVILLFFFLIFAIGGLQLWMGILRDRCTHTVTGLMEEGYENNPCGARECPSGYTCAKYVTNPFHGTVNFDDIFSSLLVVFQCVTLEGWTPIMVIVQKAFSIYVFLFFIPLVFIGAYFLLNFTLAVINYYVPIYIYIYI